MPELEGEQVEREQARPLGRLVRVDPVEGSEAAERSATAVQMATIAAASRKPLRAAGASARTGAVWVDTFAVRTEPFIGKCLNLSANAAGEQSRGTTRPPRGRGGLIAESWNATPHACGHFEQRRSTGHALQRLSSPWLGATPVRPSRAGQQRATFVVSSVQKYPPTRLRRPNTVALASAARPQQI